MFVLFKIIYFIFIQVLSPKGSFAVHQGLNCNLILCVFSVIYIVQSRHAFMPVDIDYKFINTASLFFLLHEIVFML